MCVNDYDLTEMLGEFGANSVLNDIRCDSDPDSVKPCNIDMMLSHQSTTQT